MKKIIHKIYLILGFIYSFFGLNFYRLRDLISKPKQDAVLFVSHPDDDTLFFHTYIKEYKPYVVLLTTGWSLRRIPGFKKNMKEYGVKYRIYNLNTKDTRINLLEKYIKESFSLSDFKICATHNEYGEYGHEMHSRVHKSVLKCAECKIKCPAKIEELLKHPLCQDEIYEKTEKFKKYYSTELFVLDMYSDWIENEFLTEV